MSPKDAGTWGLILGIAAIFLTIPLSMIGNILTPKLLNWWARRSLASLRRRIAGLKKQLMQMEAFPVLTETEERILASGEATHFLVFTVGYYVLGSLLLLGNLLKRGLFPENRHRVWAFPTLIMLLLLAFAIRFAFSVLPLMSYRRMRSANWREQARSAIARLEAELRRREPDETIGL